MDFDAKFDAFPDRPAPPRQVLTRAIEALAGPIEGLERLAGGYANLNYKVTTRCRHFVARIARRPRAEVEAEIAVLRHIGAGVPAPRVRDADLESATLGAPLLLLDYLPGLPLSRVEDRLTPEDAALLGHQIGNILAAIHAFTFSGCGFFGPDLTFAEPMPGYPAAWWHFIGSCLGNDLVKARLGTPLFEKLAGFLETNRTALGDLAPLARLTHSDFNAKNILVSDEDGTWRVTGILDWEFAHAGAPLTDFGNFLRFEAEQPPYRAGLLAGYEAGGGSLLPDWECKARLLDLAAMLSFLARDTEQPRTFATAKALIERTIETRT